MSLFKLCCVFFYIGLFTIGGGMVAITLMQQELVDKGIIAAEKFFNMVAISESTPGPIGVNMATYIGVEFYGVLGGILVTLSTILPSIIIIMLIARFMKKIRQNQYVQGAFCGIKPVVAGLIAVATWNVYKIALLNIPTEFSLFKGLSLQSLLSFIDIPSIIFFAIGILLVAVKKMHPIVVIALGAFFGIIFL